MNKNIIINIVSLHLIFSMFAIYYVLFMLNIFDYSDNIKYMIFWAIFIAEFISFLVVKKIIEKRKEK
jgi:hypothetical protein